MLVVSGGPKVGQLRVLRKTTTFEEDPIPHKRRVPEFLLRLKPYSLPQAGCLCSRQRNLLYTHPDFQDACKAVGQLSPAELS